MMQRNREWSRNKYTVLHAFSQSSKKSNIPAHCPTPSHQLFTRLSPSSPDRRDHIRAFPHKDDIKIRDADTVPHLGPQPTACCTCADLLQLPMPACTAERRKPNHPTPHTPTTKTKPKPPPPPPPPRSNCNVFRFLIYCVISVERVD
jgi:hypothetical protein